MTVHGTHTADPQTWSYLTGDQTVRSTWRKPTQKVPSSWRATHRVYDCLTAVARSRVDRSSFLAGFGRPS